jgi:hypothetical protein
MVGRHQDAAHDASAELWRRYLIALPGLTLHY